MFEPHRTEWFDTRGTFSHSSAERGESFYVHSENPIFKGGLSSMICHITNMLKANPRWILNLQKYDVETSSTHAVRMDFTVK